MFGERRGAEGTCNVYLSQGESGGRVCGHPSLQDLDSSSVL